MNRDILVTGASGFIGSALCRALLSRGDSVSALVHDEDSPEGCSVIRGDLQAFDDIRRAVLSKRWDAVVHLGAQSLVGVGHGDPLTTLRTNVAGTWNVLEACRLAGRGNTPGRVIVASSDKAYGHLDSSGEYHENDPLQGRGIYDCSKSCADLLCRSYAEEYGLRVLVARLGNVYGPGDPEPTRIVPSIAEDLVSIRPPTILSDGSPVRDYLYIDDAVSAYLSLLSAEGLGSERFRAYNFSGGRPVSVLELVRIATDQALRRDPEGEIWAGYSLLAERLSTRRTEDGHGYRAVPRAELEPRVLGVRGSGEIPFQALDCRRAKEELGWDPKVSLEEGLRRTLQAAWRRKNRGCRDM